MTIDGEVIPFKMLAEEGVSEVNGIVSRLVEEVEARLDDDQVLELFHSQGLLDRVRAGARTWQMLGVSVGSVAEKCGTAVARLEAVLTLLGVDSVNSLGADGDRTRNSLVNGEKTSEQRPASLWEHATQFEALVAVVENVKLARLVEAVLQACRRVEDGIRAHRDGAVCRSGSRWRASPDLPLVRICRCRAPCCGCTWSACCRYSGSFRIVRRCVPADCRCHSCALQPALGAVWTLGDDWGGRSVRNCDWLCSALCLNLK